MINKRKLEVDMGTRIAKIISCQLLPNRVLSAYKDSQLKPERIIFNIVNVSSPTIRLEKEPTYNESTDRMDHEIVTYPEITLSFTGYGTDIYDELIKIASLFEHHLASAQFFREIGESAVVRDITDIKDISRPISGQYQTIHTFNITFSIADSINYASLYFEKVQMETNNIIITTGGTKYE